MSQVTITKREYETIYVLRPDVTKETTEGLASRLSDVIKTDGALLKVENWGRRRLAYDVSKHKRGIYVYLKYAGTGVVVSEVERALNLQESVMKFQTVKTADQVGDLQVKAEDIEFQHLEAQEGDDEDETLAQTLGLEGRIHRWGASADVDDDVLDVDDDLDGSEGAEENEA